MFDSLHVGKAMLLAILMLVRQGFLDDTAVQESSQGMP